MKNLFIAVLLVIMGWLIFSRPISNIETRTEIDTIYNYDTLKIVKKGKDIPFKVLDTTYLIDEIHDTQFIVKDYSQIKAYSDTIYKDSSRFVINDTIGQNKIISRGFEALLHEKTIIKNNYIFESRNNLYLGVIGGLNTIGVGAMYSTKKGVFTLSYDKQVKVGYFKKIY
jgi:hypothetical protein